MADEDHFSLCWNNFGSNLSTGFHESLLRGDLVDVTLVAEGQMVKAHRLVLSVCSPLFRDMFATMPANQHAFVMLKDISHSTLKDLIQFIYCGEVNVRHESLTNFINVAESFKIKGMTDSMEAEQQQQQQQVIAVTSPPAPTLRTVATRITRPVTSTPATIGKVTERREIKSVVESEDSSTDDRTPVMTAPKRTASTKATSAHSKRAKAVPTSPKIEAKPEGMAMLDMPIESLDDTPGEEHEITETEEVHDSLIEEEPYEDIKYDETYFTEPEDNKQTLETTASDVNTTTEHQDFIGRSAQTFVKSRKGGLHLVIEDQVYRSNMKRMGRNKDIIYWECVRNRDIRCRARVKSVGDSIYWSNDNTFHNHGTEFPRIEKALSQNLFVTKWLHELHSPRSSKR